MKNGSAHKRQSHFCFQILATKCHCSPQFEGAFFIFANRAELLFRRAPVLHALDERTNLLIPFVVLLEKFLIDRKGAIAWLLVHCAFRGNTAV